MHITQRRLRERGQMLVMFALFIIPVTFIVGAVAVDASLWQSERRGAQKDADFVALAGAYELLNPRQLADGPVRQAAIDAAQTAVPLNNPQQNATIVNGGVRVSKDCFPGGDRYDSVTVDLDHESRTFFTRIFGVSVPDISAHARACAGSVVSTTGLRPYGIESEPTCAMTGARPASFPTGSQSFVNFNAAPKTDTPTPAVTSTPTWTATPTPTKTPKKGTATHTATATNTPSGPTATPTATLPAGCDPPADSDCFDYSTGEALPRFGAWCQLDDGSRDPSTADRGILDLNLTGPCSDKNGNDVRDNVKNGSGATCRVGDIVYTQSGAGNGNDLRGIRDLLSGLGLPPVADGAECDGPDAGTIDNFGEVLERLDHVDDPSLDHPSPDRIYQLRACTSPRVINVVIVDHFDGHQAIVTGFASFYILGCVDKNETTAVLPNRCENGSPGQLQLWGIFFNKVELDGDIGEFNPYGTQKIALVE